MLAANKAFEATSIHTDTITLHDITLRSSERYQPEIDSARRTLLLALFTRFSRVFQNEAQVSNIFMRLYDELKFYYIIMLHNIRQKNYYCMLSCIKIISGRDQLEGQ